MELLEFLQSRLGERATLAQAVDAFAEMCGIPVDSEMDMLLFESGNFGFFVSDASFQVSLVRQFTTGEEEGRKRFLASRARLGGVPLFARRGSRRAKPGYGRNLTAFFSYLSLAAPEFLFQE